MNEPTPTVLLVEDDALLRDAFRLLLEEGGYRVIEAGTAAAAVEQATTARPAVILLDVGLPDRSGLDVARELRDHDATSATPIIAMTGHTGTAEEQACLDAGCTSYLSKPVEPATLLARIPDLLS